MIVKPPSDPPVEVERIDIEIDYSDGEPPVFDLGARRSVVELREENAQLKDRIAELTARAPGAVNIEARGNCRFHTSVKIDEHTLAVTCRWCGEELDARRVLLELARKERNFCSWSEELRKQQSDLRTEIEALRKERSQLRSAIARSKKGKHAEATATTDTEPSDPPAR